MFEKFFEKLFEKFFEKFLKIFFEIFFEKIIKKEKKPLLLLPRNLAGVLDSSKKLYFCIRLSSGISKTSKPDLWLSNCQIYRGFFKHEF